MRRLTAEALGEELADRFLDPEACQRAAALMRGRPRPDPVGCCEIAFARAALLRFVIEETLAPSIAARASGAVALVLARLFDGAHTPQTAARYGPSDLPTAAAVGLAHYREAAFLSERLARSLAERLGMAQPSPEVAEDLTGMVERVVIWITRVGIR